MSTASATSVDEAFNLATLDTLTKLQSQFYEALSSSASLNHFAASWLSFSETVRVSCDKLKEDTLALIHCFIYTVETVFSNMAICETVSVDITKTLGEEFDQLTLDPVAVDDSHSSTSFPAYVEVSYKWLLKNLHNPYPTQEIRESISRESGSPRKDIDSWFIDARKRMGWNTLRKERFSNKRANIIEAATRFFLADDPSQALSPDIELEFATLQTRAQDLYSQKFFESALAVKLDMAVKEMPDERKGRRYQRRKPSNPDRRKLRQSALAYPSPERSPEPSSSSPSPSRSSISPLGSPTGNSRKRRSLSPEVDNTLDGSRKRARLSSSPTYSPIGLPSPAASVDEVPSTPESSSPSPADSASLPLIDVQAPSRKRKRGLFESVEQEPKRPCSLQNTSQQAESNPVDHLEAFLEDTAFGALLRQSTSNAIVDDLDHSKPYDIDVFDYSTYNQQPAIGLGPLDTTLNNAFLSSLRVGQPNSTVNTLVRPSETVNQEFWLSADYRSQNVEPFTNGLSGFVPQPATEELIDLSCLGNLNNFDTGLFLGSAGPDAYPAFDLSADDLLSQALEGTQSLGQQLELDFSAFATGISQVD